MLSIIPLKPSILKTLKQNKEEKQSTKYHLTNDLQFSDKKSVIIYWCMYYLLQKLPLKLVQMSMRWDCRLAGEVPRICWRCWGCVLDLNCLAYSHYYRLWCIVLHFFFLNFWMLNIMRSSLFTTTSMTNFVTTRATKIAY